jgi:hypothetical protein
MQDAHGGGMAPSPVDDAGHPPGDLPKEGLSSSTCAEIGGSELGLRDRIAAGTGR